MAPKTKETKWFGMKLTPEQKQKIKKLAARRGTNQKEAVMQLVDEAVQEEPAFRPEPGSVTESLMGSLELPDRYKKMDYKQIKQQILDEKYR